MKGLIDSHCHLDFDYAPKSADDLVREANEAGVENLITIGTEMSSLDKVRALSEQFDCVYHTVGVHPHDAKDMKEGDIDRLRNAAAHPKCVAIGEIGLDYHYDNSPRETQRERLRDQLELAAEIKKPVVIHSREAEPDLLDALKACRPVDEGRPGVIHCFTGTRKFAEEALKLGYFISFSGILTFKNAEEIRETARIVPEDRMLVETDSPFLAPVPHRGRKCEPRMVTETARFLAELRGMDEQELAALTASNTRRLFGF